MWERDNGICRACGQHVGDAFMIHHILFLSQGGRDLLDNLATLGGVPGHNCHAELAHGPAALTMRAALTVAVLEPGTTALQILRWNARRYA